MEIADSFNAFAAALEDGTVLLDPRMSYAKICEALDIEPRNLNVFLYETFGRSGPEIVDCYRGAL